MRVKQMKVRKKKDRICADSLKEMFQDQYLKEVERNQAKAHYEDIMEAWDLDIVRKRSALDTQIRKELADLYVRVELQGTLPEARGFKSAFICYHPILFPKTFRIGGSYLGIISDTQAFLSLRFYSFGNDQIVLTTKGGHFLTLAIPQIIELIRELEEDDNKNE